MKERTKLITKEDIYPQIKRGRLKKDPITIENYLGDSKALLKISALEEHWDTVFYRFISATDDYLANSLAIAFRDSFLAPYWDHIVVQRSNREKPLFIKSLKMLAGFLHTFLKRYLATPNLNIHCISELFRGEEFPEHIDADPTKYTAYCMQIFFEEKLNWVNIRPFLDLDELEEAQDLQSYYMTYIQEGRKFIKNMNPEEILTFWCNAFTMIGTMETIAPETERQNKMCRFLWKLTSAFLYHPKNSTLPKLIKHDHDIMEIYQVLTQIYPFLKSTTKALQEIRLSRSCWILWFPYQECSFDTCCFLQCTTESCAHHVAARRNRNLSECKEKE